MTRQQMTIIAFFLFLLSFSLCGAEQEYHVIQSGETLYSIAKSYSIPFDVLAQTNGITDPSKIRPGTVLKIPNVHIVAKGETFYGIAKKYGITVQDLRTANNLSESYVLKVGDVLIIPEQAVAAAVPAVPAVPVSASTTESDSSGASAPAVPASQAAPPAAAGQAPAFQSSPASQTPQSPQPAPAPQAPPSAQAPQSPQPAQVPQTPPAQTPSTPPAASAAARTIDPLVSWPVEGKGQYMSGKLEGVMFKTTKGAPVRVVASGTVVSAGPSRGFGDVVFVQSKAGFVYVYGGNETILVKTGDVVEAGKIIGKVGFDAKEGTAVSYFFVFRNGQPVDPALAPRE